MRPPRRTSPRGPSQQTDHRSGAGFRKRPPRDVTVGEERRARTGQQRLGRPLGGPGRARSAAPEQSAPSVKLQKRLAEAGMGSRRAMEELIQSGKVTVNGAVAKLGLRVAPGDMIAIDGQLVGGMGPMRTLRVPQVLLYHKPEGEIVSRSDPEGRPSVFDRVPPAKRGRWLAVGRLDFNTCGLLIFTDSGELANRLTHPRFRARRDYAVRLVGELSADQMRMLRSGVKLEDGIARFELVDSQGGEGTNRWYRVRVREGRNRLVRRMFAALGMTVSRLMRTGFGPFELPSRVKRGHWMKLDADEVEVALRKLDRDEAGSATGPTSMSRRDSEPATPPVRRSESPRAQRGARASAPNAETAKRVRRPGAPSQATPPGSGRTPHRRPRRSPAT